jgi:PAS domain S-box-containing protein
MEISLPFSKDLSAVLEAMPDALVIINKEGKIIVTNEQAEKLFGYSRVELMEISIENLIPQRYRDRHQSHFARYFMAPYTMLMGVGLELFGLKKNTKEFPIEISLSPFEVQGGMLVLAAIRDITERKNLERTFREKNIELEKANLAKNNFLASMSHELRTPLNAILGFTGTLLMKLPGPLTADQEKQLNTIYASAKHLLSLISDLLDLAKIESGKVEIHFETINCQEIIEEIANTLRPEAQKKQLDFIVNLPEQPVLMQSDRRALTQIIINLVNNAIKFTNNGCIQLTLKEENDDIKIIVVDTGIGIKLEDCNKLFTAFAQIHTVKHVEGTGLGLHLSQKLASLLGAHIECQSKFNTGSVFRLTFPKRMSLVVK